MTPLIFGEVLFDCFENGQRVLGGAPFNVAWHLAAFGQSPQLLSRVGDDEAGQQIRARMRDWGLDDHWLQTDSEWPTGEVRVTISENEPVYDIVLPSAWDLIQCPALGKAEGMAMLYHGTLALRSRASEATLLELRQQLDVPVFVDVNLRQPWWQREKVINLLFGARWIKLNEDELGLLFASQSQEAGRLAELFRISGAEQVLLTRGARGASLFHRDGRQWQVAPQRASEVVDTVGAGDGLTSIFMLGQLLSWDEQVTLERAQQFASAIVGQQGAVSEDPQFYATFQQQWGL